MTIDTTPAPCAHTTRRQLLAAAPLTAAVIAFPAVAATSTITPIDRGAWNTALFAYERVKTEDAAFSARHRPIWERCSAACKRIPHVALPPSPYTPLASGITTADHSAVRMARHEVKQMDAGKMWLDPTVPGVQEHFDWQRAVATAADQRDAAIQRVRDHFGMDPLDDQIEAFGDRLAEAEEVLMSTPAPDLAALRWKLDHLMEPDSEHSVPAWSRDYVWQTVADYQRLCGGA